MQHLSPQIFSCLLVKFSLMRVAEWKARPTDWSLAAWQPTAKHPYEKHPIFTLRLVCKHFANMFWSHVGMNCVPYSTRKLRYKGKKVQSERHFVDAFFYNHLHVTTEMSRVRMPARVRKRLFDFRVATWCKRVAWVAENTDDPLASKLYHTLKEKIIEVLGDHRSKGQAGEAALVRKHFVDFFLQLTAPLDKLADERDYEFGKERKRRPLSWYLQTWGRV